MPKEPPAEEKKKKFWSKKSNKFNVKPQKRKSAEENNKLKNFLILLQNEDETEESSELVLEAKKTQDSFGVSPPKKMYRSKDEDAETQVVKAKSSIFAPSFFTIRHEDEIARLQLGLIEDYNEPHVMFYLEADQYKWSTRRKGRRKNKAESIYDRYVSNSAIFRISLPVEVVERIQASLEEPSAELFDEAVQHISQKVYEDQYLKFLASDHFLEMLHTLWTSTEKKIEKK